MTPKKLGPYLVEDILGKGGMGTVYRGTDPESGESVALKVLSPELAEDVGFLQRFQEEVETLLELRHPNIVQLLSFGRQDEQFYFAMELVEGKSLFAMQKAGHQFSPAEAVGIAIDVCEALRHSHNLGIVHRDLKPGNIIRSQSGEIKLADYGIAKRFGGAQMTNAGVLGTAEFMAPEQARGKPATIQSDLYSLGAVIFALIHGRPPFEEASPLKTLERVVNDTPPVLGHLVTGVPDELSQLVDKLLRKNPEDRFRSAQSVQTKLKEILQLMHQRAEMETSIVTGSDEDFTTDDSQATFVEGRSGDSTAKTLTERSGSRGQPLQATMDESLVGRSKPQRVSASAPTIQEATNQEDGRRSNRVIRGNNYHERAIVAEPPEENHEKPSNIVTLLLGIGFLVVVLASVFLVWDRVVRPRTPEELWAKIEPELDRPHLVLDDIRTFEELYPEHEKAEQLKSLEELASAIVYRNKLGLRAGVQKNLREVERQFLKYTSPEEGTEFERAMLLDSMITYHRNGDELTEADEECLRAAAIFRDNYNSVSGDEFQERRADIIQRIQKADELEAAGDIQQATEIRQALINLYKNHTWADDLVHPLRDKIRPDGSAPQNGSE